MTRLIDYRAIVIGVVAFIDLYLGVLNDDFTFLLSVSALKLHGKHEQLQMSEQIIGLGRINH